MIGILAMFHLTNICTTELTCVCVCVSDNELYGFMTCQDVTPCWGWLNNNATWRNATQTRADQLSETLSELSSESQYSHIDVHYMRLDFDFLIHEWTKRGGVLRDTVEPADGFHPSQVGDV
jgi:acyloxyacyl hydrolase